MIDLDWASTSPPDRAFLEAGVLAALERPGNPSSAHASGRAARAALEEARSRLLGALGEASRKAAGLPGAEGPRPPRLVFTGSGTEADQLPLLALLRRRLGPGSRPLHVVASAIEHAALDEELKLFERFGLDLTWVKPREDGLVDPGAFLAAIRPETALLCLMAVNNETGAVQPLRAVAEGLASMEPRRRPWFHADAVQALGKLPFEPQSLGVDSAAFSAHKLRGPRGVGALWLARPFEPLSLGGGQEGGLRPGTENLQGAVAFSLAAAAAARDLAAREAAARGREALLIGGLEAMGAVPLPLGRKPGDPRYSPHILSVAFPGASGEVLARALSDSGFAVSTGSACSSNARKKGRRILDAMGLPERLSFSSIRLSPGPEATREDLEAFLSAAEAAYDKLAPRSIRG